MRKKLLVFAVGDTDGVLATLPIYKFFDERKQELNLEIMLLADMSGDGVEYLKKENIFFDHVPVDKYLLQMDFIGKKYSILFDNTKPAILICGISRNAFHLKMRLTELAHERKIPVVWLSGSWGADCDENILRGNPDYVITTGNEGANFLAEDIKTPVECRKEIRNKYKIENDENVILYYAGETKERVLPVLLALMNQLEILQASNCGKKIVFIPYFYPHDPDKNSYLRYFESWCVRFVLVTESEECHKLDAASDIVVTQGLGKNSIRPLYYCARPVVNVILENDGNYLQSLGVGGFCLPAIKYQASLLAETPLKIGAFLEQLLLSRFVSRFMQTNIVKYFSRSFDGSETERISRISFFITDNFLE